jgi:hypothetical protein
MTNEDKKLIADYMGWYEDSFFKGYRTLNGHAINFDSNDASLVVAEMQKRGDWRDFLVWQQFDTEPVEQLLYHIAYLYSADNFFNVFVEWRKGNDLS